MRPILARVQWCPACGWDTIETLTTFAPPVSLPAMDDAAIGRWVMRRKAVCPKCSGVLLEVEREVTL